MWYWTLDEAITKPSPSVFEPPLMARDTVAGRCGQL